MGDIIKKKCRVLIAEDQKLIRELIYEYITKDPEIEVVDCVENGKLAVEVCRKCRIDVVLMDLMMPLCDGIEATKKIMEYDKNIKVLVLTSLINDDKCIEATKAGACGYIIKDSSAEDIINSIKIANSNKCVFEYNFLTNTMGGMSKDLKDENFFNDLNKNELETLKLLACDGCDNKEIAKNLFISEGTVRSIVSKLLKKYDLNSRTQLAVFALKKGL